MTKPLILGFDPSKATGWAVFDTAKHLSAIECGVFEMPAKADHYFTGDQIARKTLELIKQIGSKRISFAVLEEQALAQVGRSGADSIIYPWVSTTGIVGVLANFGIPYGTIAPGAWRKMFYGQGFKPPLDKNKKNDWKAAAIIACERENITLPTRKTLAHNAAEACAVAICWKGAKFHARRYEERFMALRMGQAA